VRYAEIDGQKIVYNAHYLMYADLAITEYFRSLGIVFADPEPGFDISLVKATLEFKRPARLDELLDVHVSVIRLGNSSFTVGFSVMPHAEADPALSRAEAEVIYVSYDAAKGVAVPIPKWVRERIESLENANRESQDAP
jgi:acyl-CoA thioester hydrolase